MDRVLTVPEMGGEEGRGSRRALLHDCLKAVDTNDSGETDIADAVYLLTYLFADGPDPKPPFDACGLDTTADELTCWLYDQCP